MQEAANTNKGQRWPNILLTHEYWDDTLTDVTTRPIENLIVQRSLTKTFPSNNANVLSHVHALTSARDPENRDRLTDMVNSVFDQIRGARISDALNDDLEICICSFINKLLHSEHLIWLLDQAIKIAGSSQLKVLTSHEYPFINTETISKEFGNLRISKVSPKSSDSRDLASSLQTRIRERLSRFGALIQRCLKKESMSAVDFVFTDFAPNSAKISGMVATELARRAHSAHLLATRPEVLTIFRKFKLPQSCLPQRWKQTIDVPPNELAAMNDIINEWRMSDIEKGSRAFERCFKALVSSALPHYLGMARYWKQIYSPAIERLSPKLIVSTSYSSIQSRAAATIARKLRIRSAYIQHGAFFDSKVNFNFIHDYKLVWGKYELGLMQKHGIDPSSIYETGSCIYDKLINQETPTNPFPEIGQPIRIAFFASRAGGNLVSEGTLRQSILAIHSACQRIAPFELLIKKHPADITRTAQDVIRSLDNTRLWEGGSSQDLVIYADVVIIIASTTGYEAVLCGKPLIEFNITGVDGLVDFSKYSASILARSNSELEQALVRLREDPQFLKTLFQGRQHLITEMLDGGHGKSIAKSADVLEKLLQKSAPLQMKKALKN